MGNTKQNIKSYWKQGEQLLKWGGHSASLDKTKYNAEDNADSLRVIGCHKVMQQANIINMINKYEPQQKHRLGTVKAEKVPRDTWPLNTKQNAWNALR